jgi:hypothetical protein
MFHSSLLLIFMARVRRCHPAAASPCADHSGDIMSITNNTTQSPVHRCSRGRSVRALIVFFVAVCLSFVPLVGLTTTPARACACGCSVFDVGGLGMPEEQDHGGRFFSELWYQDQKRNYVGSSSAPASLNSDKELKTQWINVGFMYNFNRDWGMMVRIPTANRDLTTDTGTGIASFGSTGVADVEIMGIYTGFFNDMSTGIVFGLKLPTGPFRALGIDRDNQIGTGSTDLLLGAFHRGLLSGDNAWQYFAQIIMRKPFMYQSAIDPQGLFDGNPGVVQTYYPATQFDGAIGINYNNFYHVAGLDKITPLVQVIMSHRAADSGTGADPLNSGFDRVMLSPGVEFTKVVDEANKRVIKFYADIEIPIYYRANSANNAGTEGQLVAPYLIRLISSYNF